MKEKQPTFPNFFATRQSQLATVLIGVLIIIAGFLAYNLLQTSPAEEGEVGTFGELITSTPEDKGEVAGEYIVKAGDSLSKIAQETYGNTENWREIARANGIPEDNPIISVGQKLTLPEIGGPEPEETEPTPTPQEEGAGEKEAGETPETAIGPRTYTVVRGDNLWGIAEKFYGDGNKWHEIFKANNLSMYSTGGRNFPLIHAGNVLVIP